MKTIARIFLLSIVSIPAFAGSTGSMSYGPLSPVPVMNNLSIAVLGILLLLVSYRMLRSRHSSRTVSLIAAAVIAGTATLGSNQLVSRAEALPPPSDLSDPNGGTVPVYSSIDNNYQNTSGVDLIIGNVTPPDVCGLYPTGSPNECSTGFVVPAGGSCNINCLSPSDARLKHEIRYLTSTEQGIKLYAFKYLWSEQVYVGVMAQDLLQSKDFAEAVTLMPTGYYAVDYSQLGFEMKALENW